MRHPDGCPICWGVWEEAKTDPKKRLKMVNIELTKEEARVLALTLEQLMRRISIETRPQQRVCHRCKTVQAREDSSLAEIAAMLQPFRLMIMRAVKDVL
jgi:hypothetical protein